MSADIVDHLEKEGILRKWTKNDRAVFLALVSFFIWDYLICEYCQIQIRRHVSDGQILIVLSFYHDYTCGGTLMEGRLPQKLSKVISIGKLYLRMPVNITNNTCVVNNYANLQGRT